MMLDEYLSADFKAYTIYKNSGKQKGEIVLKFRSKKELNWHCFRYFNKPLFNPLM